MQEISSYLVIINAQQLFSRQRFDFSTRFPTCDERALMTARLIDARHVGNINVVVGHSYPKSIIDTLCRIPRAIRFRKISVT